MDFAFKPGTLVIYNGRTIYTAINKASKGWFNIRPGMIGMYIGPMSGAASLYSMILFGDKLITVARGTMVKYV